MSFSKYGFRDKQYELARSVLLLSSFVIGIKAWNVDLKEVKVFDVSISQYGASVFLGVLGLVLWVTLAAYVVSNVEQFIDSRLDAEAQDYLKNVKERPWLLLFTAAVMPLALAVYSLPLILGSTAAWIVRHEALNALGFIISHL